MKLRTRLTVLYGGAFLLAGSVLIAVVYFLVRERLYATGLTRTDAAELGSMSGAQLPPDKDTVIALVNSLIERQDATRAATLESLLVWSAVALVLVGVFAVGFGWLMAGRVLRPIEAITETARRVADRNLHERINLAGPGDELKRLADTFDEMLERLDRSFDGQRRFVANASHELRTPLAINRTLLEVAAARPDPDGRVGDLTANLLAVNVRHERLIDGLLTLAASENPVPRPAPVDLADVVAHVAGQLTGEAVDAGVTVSVDASPAFTSGDAMLLERLVQNLIANGIRHNTKGGTIDVATTSEDGKAVLTVTNTGPHVPAYEIPALFQPFRRGEGNDRVESARGVGLGLSIVDAVVRAHDGRIEVEARDGGGLVLRVELEGEGRR
ncbi:sensor histidine kinase [Phytomonospora endophytica]|uniref:histidine kinase n=1 Tax=Phytomonospora endophytica TaxID=714109 RepID=A0A841FQL7_9ACTN|nr:HAMP domain-containing sensor histidine kinase [Phytomonospora endophytica]MBB6037123.1 signal transduction histidine kinase [Phytomonospora endophytica]GIG71162.1 sensor protein CutS [Phytomonospora endophytica]